MADRRITVIGVSGETLSTDAARAVRDASLVVGGRRLLQGFAASAPRTVAVEGDVSAVLDAVGAEVAATNGGGGAVCVLASGDPGFFGIVRPLAERFGAAALDVHPSPSSVSLAFAKLGLPWDDAVVASAHGRPLEAAAAAVAAHPKVAVLTSPDSPPEALGRRLLASGAGSRRVAVCSRLGLAGERVAEVDVEGLAAGTWDPLSVVVVLGPAGGGEPHGGGEAGNGAGVAKERTLAWGLPVGDFAHRDGMVTKAEVRAVVLGKLALPSRGVLWDVGAGCGSVAVECARLAPHNRVIAVEADEEQADRVRANARSHGVQVEVVVGEAPGALAPLPRPDRVFVGGGGTPVLDAALIRLAPGGRLVATFAAVDRAAAAHRALGHLVQVGVSRAETLPDGGVRLRAENPVFVAWGPAE